MITRKLLLNTLCEFGPISAFLTAYEIADFETGVIAMIIATLVSLVVLKRAENHVPLFALISAGSVIFFGGLTLVIHVPDIFILRDTIFDGVFGVALLTSAWMGKPLFRYLFRGVFAITDRGWMLLTRRWGFFFLFLAAANEWVRLMLSPDQWVAAKIVFIIASVIFGGYQFILTRRERLPHATPWGIAA
jgi:intracellular septation protein